MSYEEILKTVFPLLEGADLASCMVVCKQWRDIAQDDYFWKRVCAKRWPSICKRRDPPTVTYYKLYQTFYKRQGRQILLPPRLSFDNLEFFIDIWTEDKLIFSEVVPGPALHTGIKSPPPGIFDRLRFQLEGHDCKMTLPVEPGFKVPLSETVSVSVLVGRKDSNKVACIINKSVFDYIDRTSYRAMAFDYLGLSPAHLLFQESGLGFLCCSWMIEMTVSLMSLGLKWTFVMLQNPGTRFCGCLTYLIGSEGYISQAKRRTGPVENVSSVKVPNLLYQYGSIYIILFNV